MMFIIYLEFETISLSWPISTFRSITPALYALCAVSWVVKISLSSRSFVIEPLEPNAVISSMSGELQNIIEGRDPCIFPSANIMHGPFGFTTSFSGAYDVNCGADTLVSNIGEEAISRLLIINEWMGQTSTSAGEVDNAKLFAAQAILNESLETEGEVALDTNNGRIILQTNQYLDHVIIVEPLSDITADKEPSQK